MPQKSWRNRLLENQLLVEGLKEECAVRKVTIISDSKRGRAISPISTESDSRADRATVQSRRVNDGLLVGNPLFSLLLLENPQKGLDET